MDLNKMLLTILLVLQIIVMLYLLYINHRRFKEDKKYWEHQEKVFHNIIEDMKNQPAIMLNTEENESEQEQPEIKDKK